jgi:dTMP kinase
MLGDLERWVHGDLQPDLTLWFDVDPAVAAARRARARVSDRFESEDTAFFERVRAGYAARMREAPQRFCRIDSALEKAAVQRQIDSAIAALEERRR